jgi:arylsulfatase A-like enzyme
MRWFLSLWLLTWSGLLVAADRLNVVVFLIDDLGQRDLGCYGSKYYRTPHLDQLAAQGLRFTDGYAACPVCSPTRAALLTGKYPARLHLTDWLPGVPTNPTHALARPALRQELPLAEVTLAELLKEAGYATALIGKWHLGGAGFGPEQQGFTLNIGGTHQGQPPSYFAPFGKTGPALPGLIDAPAGEYLTDRLAAEAVKFISTHTDKPFFLYLPHYAVHTPLQAPEAVVKQYPPGKPGSQGNPTYAAMVERMDAAVGAVLTALDTHKLRERTLVLFTSDNGGLSPMGGLQPGPTNNSPLREGKGFLYEGGLRVPLLVRWPGVTKPGSTTSVPASSIDLLPTIAEATGLTVPMGLDGKSLVPVCRGERIERAGLFWHYPHYHGAGGKPGGVVRAGDLKLIEFYETGRQELFDVVKDLGESRNLAGDRPADVARLAQQLADWRQSVNAQMMSPNPQYLPHPPVADGSITLPARGARVTGTQLRYEPLAHKQTLGYWTQKTDSASWELTPTQAGTYSVEVLQGCGKGSGGAEVEIAVGTAKLTFVVEDTGGFQNFVARQVGMLTLAAGRQTLTVRALSKPGVAVMDLRQLVLRPMK